MRTIAIVGVAAATFILAPAGAEAARWCHAGANAKGCAYSSQAQCARAAQRAGGSCHQQFAARVLPNTTAADGPYHTIPGQIYPNRPFWSSPFECFTDDGGGRYRPCSAGGDGGGIR